VSREGIPATSIVDSSTPCSREGRRCYENARDQRRDSEISRRIQGNGRRTFRRQGKKEVGILFIHGLCTAHG